MSYDSGHYNRGGMIAFVFSMVATSLFFIYVTFIHPGVDLKEVTPAGEVGKIMTAQQDDNVDISDVKEPWAANPKMVARGKTLFKQNCQMCHGPEGKGDGPAASGLVPPPRNLVKGEWKKGGSQVGLFTVVTEGLPGSSMASWKQIPERDRWALVQFIQSITQNKVDKPDELKTFIAGKK
jgi:mono/diheme cytochrome c family protein